MIGGSRGLAMLAAAALLAGGAGPALADAKPPTAKDRQLASELDNNEIARNQAGDHSPASELRDAPATSGGNSRLRYTGIASGAAGLVAVGIGVYAGVQGKQISDEINQLGEQIRRDPMAHWPDNIQDLQRRGDNYNRLQ